MNTAKILLKRFWAGVMLGHGAVEKLKASIALPLISMLRPVCIRFKKFNKSFVAHFSSGSDVAMWVEVFMDEEYKLKESFKPKRILDLGANAGFSSLYFTIRDPEAMILAVEPDPNNFKMLSKNIAPFANIKARQMAVSSRDEQREFFSHKNQGMRSSFIKRASADVIVVPTLSLNSLLLEQGWDNVDLIKFDIEGAEREVFERTRLDKVKALIGEYHEDLTGRPVADFLNLFTGFQSKIVMTQPQRYIVFLNRAFHECDNDIKGPKSASAR